MDQVKIPSWEVDISVVGSVAIKDKIYINTRKDINHQNPLYSDVIIKNTSNGFDVTLTAFAYDEKLAEKAAILFLGRMLDALTLDINMSLQLDFHKNIIITNNTQNTRRVISKDDLKNAFNESRLLSLTENTFSRALSWFRKGKYTQDPFDRFLAFWNSIETVANKYNPNKSACKKKGTICHTWECFKLVWGDLESWEFIGGQNKWIDSCNEIRKNIAHGIMPIEIRSVEQVINKLVEVENVAHKFLKDWRKNQLSPVITQEIKQKLS